MTEIILMHFKQKYRGVFIDFTPRGARPRRCAPLLHIGSEEVQEVAASVVELKVVLWSFIPLQAAILSPKSSILGAAFRCVRKQRIRVDITADNSRTLR